MSSKYFLAFIIIVAIIVVAAVAWTGRQTAVNDLNAQNNQVDNSQTNSNSNTNVTSTAEYTIIAEAEITNVGDITTYIFTNDNILNIMPATMQATVLNETPIKTKQTINVDGIEGQELVISSAKDGSESTIVQIVNGDTLFDFRGNTDYLANLTNYIKFNKSN